MHPTTILSAIMYFLLIACRLPSLIAPDGDCYLSQHRETYTILRDCGTGVYFGIAIGKCIFLSGWVSAHLHLVHSGGIFMVYSTTVCVQINYVTVPVCYVRRVRCTGDVRLSRVAFYALCSLDGIRVVQENV